MQINTTITISKKVLQVDGTTRDYNFNISAPSKEEAALRLRNDLTEIIKDLEKLNEGDRLNNDEK